MDNLPDMEFVPLYEEQTQEQGGWEQVSLVMECGKQVFWVFMWIFFFPIMLIIKFLRAIEFDFIDNSARTNAMYNAMYLRGALAYDKKNNKEDDDEDKAKRGLRIINERKDKDGRYVINVE